MCCELARLQCEGEVFECRHLPVLGGVLQPGEPMRGAGASLRLQDVVDRHVLRVLKDCGGNKYVLRRRWESAGLRSTGCSKPQPRRALWGKCLSTPRQLWRS